MTPRKNKPRSRSHVKPPASHTRLAFEHLEERRLLAADITVNSTGDADLRDDALTLREAILINNRTLSVAALTAQEKGQVSGTPTAGDADTIRFDIPANDPNHFYYQDDGVEGQVTLANRTATTEANDADISDIDPDWAHSWFSIQPTPEPNILGVSGLPGITEPVIIDGYTQAGASENTNPVGQGLNTILKIEISGEQAGLITRGLMHVGSGSGTTIRGLALNQTQGPKINLDNNSSDTIVAGNFIGSDVSGTEAFTPPEIENPPGSLVNHGVMVRGADSTIGGLTPDARNLISGNNFVAPTQGNAGILLGGFGGGNLVLGNLIGVDRTGTHGLENAGSGVLVTWRDNTIGGVDPAAGNVIAGNNSGNANDETFSVLLAGSNADNNLIQNNLLGTDPTGTIPLGAGGGISLILTASDNQIVENTIAFGAGVRIDDGSTGNLISQNSIFSNVGSGIDLDEDDVTFNDVPPDTDPPDQDSGANELQNYPILTTVTDIGGGTRIEGTLESTPDSDFRIEFFANSDRDYDATGGDVIGGEFRMVLPGEFGEGETYLGLVDGTTDAGGVFNFSVDLAGVDLAAMDMPYVTATATDITDVGAGPRNNTSEFSPVVVLGGPSFVVTSTADTGLGTLREAIISANLTPGQQTITFAVAADDPGHFYYADDGIDGQVSFEYVSVTTEANDGDIVGIDPDWAHSWFGIILESELPEIVETVIIDGYSQAGASQNTLAFPESRLDTVLKIELDGRNVAGDGLTIGHAGSTSDSSGNVVQGLAINSFGGDGIRVRTLDGGNTIAGNFIGPDVSGTINFGNAGNGVFLVDDDNHTVGGPNAGDRNLFSGNVGHQIEILAGSGVVEGNLLGGDRNSEIFFAMGGSYISMHNDQSQLPVQEASHGISAGEGNVSSHSFSKNFTIINSDGLAGGIISGILFTQFTDSTFPAEARQFFYMLNKPVEKNGQRQEKQQEVQPFSSSAISAGEIATELIFLGIDLGGDGITPNDAGDLDDGPNGLQNYPVLANAVTAGGNTTINGTLNSWANTSFSIEIYASSFDTSIFRAGEQSLGTIVVTTDGDGNAPITFVSPELVPVGHDVIALATRLEDGTLLPIETSEFSAGIIVTSSAQLPGDYNADGRVSAADYVLWRNTEGDSVAPFAGADGDGNGMVDEADYQVWRSHFGQSRPAASAASSAASTVAAAEETSLPAATPEPSLMFILNRPRATASAGQRIASEISPAVRSRDEVLLAWLAEQPDDRRQAVDLPLDAAGSHWSPGKNSGRDDLLEFEAQDTALELLDVADLP